MPRAAPRSLSDAFLAEHAAIDELLDDVVQAIEAGDPGGAAERWSHFRSALAAHLRAEDTLIAALGSVKSAHVLGHEHRFIRQEVDELDRQAAAKTLSAHPLRVLGYILRAHARNDERLLYSSLDGALTEGRRRAALDELDARLPQAVQVR